MVETALGSLAVRSAWPTITVDGQAQPRVTALLLDMEMTEQEGGMSALELRLTNVASQTDFRGNFAFEDDQILKLGATLVIGAGDQASPHEIFRGTITGLEAVFAPEHSPELVVLAEDAFQRGRLTRRTKVHENVTIAALGNELAARLGLTPKIDGLSQPIGTHVQFNESDLAFLRRFLAQYDADMQISGNTLILASRSHLGRGTVELVMTSQLHRARVTADLAHQVTEVTTGGWDPSQGQRVSGRSTGANLGPGTGTRGATVVNRAFGSLPRHVAHLTVATNDEAQALADAVFDLHARRFVCVKGTADGNPLLRVGSQVHLTGMGSRFDNTYYVVRTCHRFHRFGQQAGYHTDFEAECAYWGGS